MVCRRVLCLLFGLVLLPAPAPAQPRPDLPLVVVVGLSAPADQMRAFAEGLRQRGHVDGATVAIEYHSAQGREDELPALARHAVARRPAVIAAIGAKAGRAVRDATATLPVVVVTGDIRAAGLVENLAHPEANITGLSFFNVDLPLKRFEILLELAPRLRRLNLFHWGRQNPTQRQAFALLAGVAEGKGIELGVITIDRIEAIAAALQKLPAGGENALLISATPVFDARPAEIGRLTGERRLIAMLPWKQYVHAGGLISYSPDIVAIWRRASYFVDRILRGAKPGELPVEQPTDFELVINLNTARALGLTVSPALLLRASELVE